MTAVDNGPAPNGDGHLTTAMLSTLILYWCGFYWILYSTSNKSCYETSIISVTLIHLYVLLIQAHHCYTRSVVVRIKLPQYIVHVIRLHG